MTAAAELLRSRRRPRHPSCDRRRPRRDAVRRGGCGIGQDQGARRPRRRVGHAARRAHARDRGRHLHREGGGRAARPDPTARWRPSPVSNDTVASARAAQALEELDGAAVATLHAFAQRLLTEHPIEAGLPPRVEVLDDIASQLAFEERWTRFVDELLDDPALERALLLALNADTTLAVLRTLALACNANWDLVAERMGPEPDPPPLTAKLAPVLTALAELQDLAAHCRAADDKLLGLLVGLAAWHTELLNAPDEYEQLRLLTAGTPKGSVTHGRKDNWPAECSVESVRDQVKALRALVAETAAGLAEAVVRRLAWELAQFTLREADARRRRGQLEFHDLLVLARAVLRDPEHGWDVRRRLRARYTPAAARRVPGHRPDPVRPRRAARVGRTRRTRPPLGRAPHRRRASVRRRRPEAVDLPLPPRRHRRLPPRPLRVRRRASPTHPQLPHRRARHRLRQLGVPRAHHRRAGIAARIRGPRAGARRSTGRTRRWCSWARCPSSRSRRPTSSAKLEARDVAAVVGRALREGWEVSRRTGDTEQLRPVSARRHLHPPPRAHLARPSRRRPRRRRHPLPRRDVVARLQHP